MIANISPNLNSNKIFSWSKKNLFSSWVNSIMTIIALIFIYKVGTFFLNWAIFEADFTTTNIQGCNTLTVDFQDLSSINSDVIWDFGDGNSSIVNNPTHIYTSEGLYDVTLFSISLDGCKDTLKRKEYIQFEYPVLDFTISDNKICNNTEITFTNFSEGINLVYNWDFGDGDFSTEKNPQHIYNLSLIHI